MLRYALLLLLIPLTAHGQVRCPDGSYRSSCPGGDGEAVGAPLSTYESPNFHQRPLIRRQNQPQRQSSPRRQQGLSAPPDRPRSTSDRAQGMGLTRNELVRAINRRELIRGMERADVERIAGRPFDVDRFESGGQTYERWWYRHRNRWSRLIILRDGRFESSYRVSRRRR